MKFTHEYNAKFHKLHLHVHSSVNNNCITVIRGILVASVALLQSPASTLISESDYFGIMMHVRTSQILTAKPVMQFTNRGT